MYNIPAVADKEEQLKHTELLDLEVCEEQCDAQDQYPCEESLFQLCVIEMADNGWNIPSNGVDAVTLYILLRRQIKTFVWKKILLSHHADYILYLKIILWSFNGNTFETNNDTTIYVTGKQLDVFQKEGPNVLEQINVEFIHVSIMYVHV